MDGTRRPNGSRLPARCFRQPRRRHRPQVRGVPRPPPPAVRRRSPPRRTAPRARGSQAAASTARSMESRGSQASRNSALRRSSGHPEPSRRMQYYGIDPVSSDPPKHRPLERFWPYAELPEQPTDEELAALDPDLHEALFGARPRPFSITLVFADLDTAAFPAALDLARASAEFRETGTGAARRYRARFWTTDAARLRELFEIVGASDATEVLVDDRPVPYARELWLPLVW